MQLLRTQVLFCDDAPGDLSYTGTVQKQKLLSRKKKASEMRGEEVVRHPYRRLPFLFESPVSGMCPLSVGEMQ